MTPQDSVSLVLYDGNVFEIREDKNKTKQYIINYSNYTLDLYAFNVLKWFTIYTYIMCFGSLPEIVLVDFISINCQIRTHCFHNFKPFQR